MALSLGYNKICGKKLKKNFHISKIILIFVVQTKTKSYGRDIYK